MKSLSGNTINNFSDINEIKKLFIGDHEFNERILRRYYSRIRIESLKYLFDNKIIELDKEHLDHYLEITIEDDFSEYFKLFMELGAEICDNDIYLACSKGNLDIVKYIHQKGVNLNIGGNYPLYTAVSNTQFDVVKYLIEEAHMDINTVYNRNGNKENLLMTAIFDGSVEMVLYLLQNGADYMYNDQQPIDCILKCRRRHAIIRNLIDIMNKHEERTLP